ncbi:MAG: hypothetical protein HYZ28_22240 [Myxococcales bacterium]|nr:hypothetical protein [Myxococcales bacterium]
MRFAIALGALLSPLAAFAEDAAELAAQIDQLHPRRDDPAAAKELEEAVSKALKAYPDDYGILWRAARARWWVADGAAERLKKQLGKEAWLLGERAVKAKPDGAEGHYYAAIGIGAYSQAVGILKALSEGLEGKFLERLDKSIQMNPDLDAGGPLVVKGRYFFELPWPKRDLKKSRETLEMAVHQHPEGLRAYLFLAETLLADGQAKKAKEVIAEATGDVAYDPPEGRRVHALAKKVAAQIEEELK